MGEVKEYKVTIETKDMVNSESFHINGDEEFTMNGKTYKFNDVFRITIADADGNGGWNSKDLDISSLFGKGKKKI
ncbi:MAG TPA: hypothetical protein K8V56_10675 [Sporosarcina psychrophila]|uniref:Uncharacterized protein n=1 Tax=Sporosarcina psychrophila TaxID=1476 RepID=A0A921KEN8_SPOPS|nr:hypothetical protein [Sporosarcina psychrophila]